MATTYRTKQGDMWDSVAYNEMGSEQYVGQLMLANGKYLDYYLLPAGLELVIPDVSTSSETASVPWRLAEG